MKEFEYVEGIIIFLKFERRIYRVFSDFLVGIIRDEVIEYIERSRFVYKREIEKFKKREKEIMEELLKFKVFFF